MHATPTDTVRYSVLINRPDQTRRTQSINLPGFGQLVELFLFFFFIIEGSFFSFFSVFSVFNFFLSVFLSVIRDKLRARARASRSAACFFFSSGREELVAAPVRLAGSSRILLWTFFMKVGAGLFPTVTGYLPSVTGSFPSVTYSEGMQLELNLLVLKL